MKCHRALKTVCQLIGIEDVHCKVEGSTKNIKCVVKGFFEALQRQVLVVFIMKFESYRSVNDCLLLHVVKNFETVLQ